jgi:hypothetical protein
VRLVSLSDLFGSSCIMVLVKVRYDDRKHVKLFFETKWQ